MPGKPVKKWKPYEALRAKGKSKESAARMTNAANKKKKAKPKMHKMPGGHMMKGAKHGG